MPQHDPTGASGPSEPFAEELGAALRTTGDAFSLDGRPELIAGGLARGRRRLFRRRLAVTGGALALVGVAAGGVYGGLLVQPGDGPARAAVAGAPEPAAAKPTSATEKPADPAAQKPGETLIPVTELAAVLKTHTPAGRWEIDNLDGRAGFVTGVYDDGRGKAAVSVGLHRAGRSAEAGLDQVTCPEKAWAGYDDCDEERLPNGSRLMVLQGYEYPDRREETKNWRAVLLTKDGFLIDASEYNAPAEKGAAVTRQDPPFTPAQLKTLVTAEGWRPLLRQIPPLPTAPADPGTVRQAPPEPKAAAVQATLRSLLPKGLRVVEDGGQDGYGRLVVDDGHGRSLIGVNVQYGMGDVAGELFGSGDVTTLPDGRKVKLSQEPGEKGGAGVVWWRADTITPDGFRVVVSAFNTDAQHRPATRPEPAVTMRQLEEIALSPKWARVPTTR